MFMKKNYFFILYCYAGGGTEKVFCHTADSILKNNPDAKIYLYVCQGFDKKYFVPENVTVVDSFPELKKIYKSSCNREVINFSGFRPTSSAAFKLAGFKMISWIHCNPFSMTVSKSWPLNFFLLKHSKKVICVCKEQMEILQKKFGFKNNVQVIYNPVNFPAILEKSKEEIPLKDKYFLMCARMDFDSKDFFTVVDAYSKLPVELQNEYKLVFLGDGPDRPKVEQYIASKQMNSNIILTGFDSNPYRWMKNAACGILSSKTEGFSLFPIEAFACGLPMIITKYKTGAIELSNNNKNCFIVNVGDSDQMSQMMQTMVTDSDTIKNFKNNFTQFIKNFGTENFNNQIITLFNDGDKNE